MSLLSNQHYEHLGQLITHIKHYLAQQTQEQTQNHTLISIKVQILEEQVHIANQQQTTFQTSVNQHIQAFHIELKSKFQEILHQIYDGEEIQEIQREFKELQSNNRRILKTNSQIQEQYLLRLQKEINILQERYTKKIKEYNEQKLQFQLQIKKQITFLQSRMNQLSKCNNQDFLVQAQALKKQFTHKMVEIRKKRKERKEVFLNLLQNIVEKCKEEQKQK